MRTSDLYAAYDRDHLSKVRWPDRARIAWKHLYPIFGHHLPEQIGAMHFVDFFRRRAAASDGTLNRELGVLAAVLAYGRKAGFTTASPYIPKRSSPAAKDRVLSGDEQQRLLSAATGDTRIFLELALLTGQRKDAIIKLKWRQVKWDVGVVDFNDTTDKLSNRAKGRGVIPITDELRSTLYKAIAESPEPGDYVLRHLAGSVGKIDWAWDRLCHITGIIGVTPHVLRHTVATRLVCKGVPLLEVSRLLGHKSIKTTEKFYLSLTPDFVARAAKELTLG